MGRIVYIVGRTVDGRQRLLEEKLASHGLSSILHLVPTRGRVMELEVDPDFWLTRRVETLARIVQEIFDEHLRPGPFKQYRPLDHALKCLLIKKILEKRGMEPDGLAYFSPLLRSQTRGIDFPGIYRTIANFFALIVRNNLQDRFVEDLAKRIIRMEEKSPGTGEERHALESDLAWLFADFEEIKREVRGYDAEDITSSVRSYLREGGRAHILGETDILILDGFLHFSRVEEDILFHFFRQVREVWWLIDYDSEAKDPIGEFKEAVGRGATRPWADEGINGHGQLGPLEAHRIFTPLVSLMQRAEEARFDCIVLRAHEDPFTSPVARGLYFHGLLEGTPEAGLKIKSFAHRLDEVRAIAGEIKRIIHEDGLDPSGDLGRIRIIFPELDDYATLTSEVFSEYRLPISLTKGMPLSSHPLANIFRLVFEIPLNRFNREDIFRLFSSALIRGDYWKALPGGQRVPELKEDYLIAGEDPSDGARFIQNELGVGGRMDVDISLIDRVARKCGLERLGGETSGLRQGDLLRVRDYYRSLFLETGSAREREDLLTEYYRFLAQVDWLERGLTPFEELANQSSPEGIEACFSRILHMLGLPENILTIGAETSGMGFGATVANLRRDIKAYNLLKDLVGASANEVRIARALFGINDGVQLLSRFYSVFGHRLNNAYLLDERNPNVIRVSEWLEIRGRAFDYIFAGGLSAERFPLREEVNFILTEAAQRMFRIRAPTEESMHLFGHLLRNCRKGLYLSYPRYRNEKEVQPSPVLVDLESVIKSRLSPESGSAPLEEVFKWEENPYITSETQLLDATCARGKHSEATDTRFFPLNRILFKYDSPAEDLIRRIDALRSRWAGDGLFDWDGLVERSTRFAAYLEDKGDIFSPSQLETLANCPMRYLFAHIYGLRPLEELGPEVSPRDMGEHLHAILRDFFGRLISAGKNVAEIGLARAFSLAREVSEDYFQRHPFLKRLEFFAFQKGEFLAGLDENPDERGQGKKGREGIFAQLLRFEERAFPDRLPAAVEYGFGQQGSVPVYLGKAKIRGYIDRFDRMKGDDGAVYIYDYKSGRVPSSEMVKKGLSFQLPAYMLALRSQLQSRRVSAAFYTLKREVLLKENPLKHRIHDHREGAPGLDITGVRLLDEYVNHLMGLLERGFFHHSTDEMICPHCEFRYACYKDMRRMNHMVSPGGNIEVYSGEKNLEKWGRVDAFRRKRKEIFRSMQKALSLKTESARSKHYESVMDYKDWLREKGGTLPFRSEYIAELLQEIEHFEKKYLSS